MTVEREREREREAVGSDRKIVLNHRKRNSGLKGKEQPD